LPACPSCHSRKTIRTHEQLGEQLFFCAKCEHTWKVERRRHHREPRERVPMEIDWGLSGDLKRRCLLCASSHVMARTLDASRTVITCHDCLAVLAVEMNPSDKPTIRGRIEMFLPPSQKPTLH
jgi:transcription elongation factor Elf1